MKYYYHYCYHHCCSTSRSTINSNITPMLPYNTPSHLKLPYSTNLFSSPTPPPPPPATSCFVTWTFRGQTTPSLLFNAPPGAVQAALQGLDSVGSVIVNATSSLIATGIHDMTT